MNGDNHTGDVIRTVPNPRYAYEDCHVLPGAYFEASPPDRGDPEERRRFTGYQLTIIKHTDRCVLVTLRKELSGSEMVRQRKERGFATEEEVYTTTMSFQELCNRLLGPGCYRCEETEALPEAVKETMRQAYP